MANRRLDVLYELSTYFVANIILKIIFEKLPYYWSQRNVNVKGGGGCTLRIV